MSDRLEAALASLEKFRHAGWRLGLDRIEALLSSLGDPHQTCRFVHIAGTNGKGSTTAFVEAVLRSQGYRTGAAFSPYVYEVTERIQVAGKPWGRDRFAEALGTVIAIAHGMDGSPYGLPTEFEIKTAAGFLAWAQEGCDVVALEVGLGGRLDATNVVDPAVSVIVSIGLDHTEHLGTSLARIAREKAGIIKAGRPVVVGEMPPEAGEVVESVAAELGSPVLRFGREIALDRSGEGWRVEWPDGSAGPFQPGIQGCPMPHNAALALASCAAGGFLCDGSLACRAVAETRLPGRMERRTWSGREWILDGAHNEDAARMLAASLPEPLDVIVGMLEGHDVRAFGRALGPRVRRAFVVPIAWHRSRDARELAGELAECGWEAIPCTSIADAFARLDGTQGTVLVTGSFYLVGEVGRFLSALE
ncbi:MAG: bifunctional folylpolyglutamate synthase/dihydrofolate synthase [Fimbriimonadaceae bacterium]|nr:bifunctional folylpolyglutamate synthase/dihydrofolate synthase [Fimbriimonadaceae bacterium]